MQGNQQVTMYSSVGIDAGVTIEVKLAARDTEVVGIHIGYGPELIIDCGDVESLERLRDVAAEGARLLQERIEENSSTDARGRAGDGSLAAVGAAR